LFVGLKKSRDEEESIRRRKKDVNGSNGTSGSQMAIERADSLFEAVGIWRSPGGCGVGEQSAAGSLLSRHGVDLLAWLQGEIEELVWFVIPIPSLSFIVSVIVTLVILNLSK